MHSGWVEWLVKNWMVMRSQHCRSIGQVMLVGEICEWVFHDDVRVGVVGAVSDLDCGVDLRRPLSLSRLM